MKEVSRREGTESISGREVKIGKLKSTSSKRDVPLNQAAVDAILELSWAQTCYNAALQVGANVIPQSLMDYLS